jgi:hypothetical protein
VTIQTDPSTPPGVSLLTITGSSDTLAHAVQVGLFVTNAVPGSGTIGVDFAGSGVAVGPIENAGVVAKPNWNEAIAGAGSLAALVDETGAATLATIDWNATAIWSLGIPDNPGDDRMMKGYLDPTSQAATVTVANLPADAAGYYIYVYADGDNGNANRTGTYRISGPGIATTSIDITDAANTDFNGAFTRAGESAGNYAVFFIDAQGFTLTATPGTASDGAQRAPLNGIQIVHGDRIFGNGFD